MLILLNLLFTPIRIEAGREPTTPYLSAEKPGPHETIANEMAERKEKSQKRLEKCEFFEGMWKTPLKQRVTSDSNASSKD
jgi:hypothetical protein